MDSGSAINNTKRRRKTRLSLSLNKKVITESPKTPTVRTSSITSETSPTVARKPTGEILCSTPLNTRKRYCPPDNDSPILENQDSPILMTNTQELRRFGTDVTWQWNSPKRHLADETKLKEKTQRLRKGIHNGNQQDSPSPNRVNPLEKMPIQLIGFHKFQKVLQELKDGVVTADSDADIDAEHRRSDANGVAIESLDNDLFETAKTSLDENSTQKKLPTTHTVVNVGAGPSRKTTNLTGQLSNVSIDVFQLSDDSSSIFNGSIKKLPTIQRVKTNLNKSFDDLSKAGCDLNTSGTDEIFRKYKSSDNFSLKNQVNEFFDDSDFEFGDALEKCSQQIEENLKQVPVAVAVNTEKAGTASTSTNDNRMPAAVAMPDPLINDSMDDFFSQIPINDLVASVEQKSKPSTSFGRHNSMPESPRFAKSNGGFQYKQSVQQQAASSTRITGIQRHLSMPPTNMSGLTKPIAAGYLSSEHSSVESLPTSSSMSQSNPQLISNIKCTPAEIERKRQLAIQRRKATVAKMNYFKAKK